jgi:hypothetical protein
MRYDRVTRQFGYAPPGLYPDLTDTVTPLTVNAADYLALDRPPIFNAAPSQAMRVPVWFSHFSSTPLPRSQRALLRWRLAGYDGSGTWQIGPTFSRTLSLGTDLVSHLATITVTAPATAFAGDLAVWLQGVGETPARVLARNTVAAVVAPQVTSGLAVSPQGPGRRTTATWTFEPGQYTQGDFTGVGPVREADGQAAWGSGSGYLEYRLVLPPALRALLQHGHLASVSFQGEASAERRASARDESAPQTDAQPWPSAVRLDLDGVSLWAGTLPGDPSDARGILSLQNGYHWGEYGYVLSATLPAADPRLANLGARLRRAGNRVLTLRFSIPATAAQPGGLALYGESVGRIPAPLTLRLIIASP